MLQGDRLTGRSYTRTPSTVRCSICDSICEMPNFSIYPTQGQFLYQPGNGAVHTAAALWLVGSNVDCSHVRPVANCCIVLLTKLLRYCGGDNDAPVEWGGIKQWRDTGTINVEDLCAA